MVAECKLTSLFPPGTPVVIRQQCLRRTGAYQSEVIGVVDGWEKKATGSWHAHGKNSKLWLQYVRLKKSDGELSMIVIDDTTEIARIEAATN